MIEIQGKPLLRRVWESVCSAACFSKVCIATDSDEIRSAAQSWGAGTIMTEAKLNCGTERVASILHEFPCDHFVNVQADMPFLDPRLLNEFVREWKIRKSTIITPVYRIDSSADLFNPNLVKVARSQSGQAIYFSRQAIPYQRDLTNDNWISHGPYWAHIGIYGYRRSALQMFFSQSPSRLELAERLEQLRFAELGLIFDTYETAFKPKALDSQADCASLGLSL